MRYSITAAMLAAAVAVVAAQPAATDLVVILDSDSPVAQSDRAERLRDVALAGFDTRPRLSSFQLTERGVSPIPSLQPDTLRALHFEYPPRVYSGVVLSVNEAAEILRGNEPVREEVVLRSCAERPGCAGLVRTAAIALIDDIETVTANKMRALGEAARLSRGKTIVLMTAGWPARPARVRLDEVVAELAAAGVSLVVWKLPSSIPYGGLVNDAADTLAMRVRARQVVIRDEREAGQAREAYAAAAPTDTPTPTPDMPSPSPSPTTVTPAPPAPPSPAPADETFGAAGLTDATLRRAAGYVESFERTFAAVTWRERYQQEAHTQTRFNASGGRFTVPSGRRVLDSELLLVWLPADASWLSVRDVVAVDGVRRAEGDRRVSRALGGTPISVAQLKELASENGRYNIGRILRTFNEPTFALLLLDDQHRRRFAFRRAKRESIGGRRAVTYEFLERARPTLIKDGTRDVPARGTLWIDESSGQILQTTLELEQKEEGLRGTMTVRYAAHPEFDVLVPVEMRETYLSTAGEEVTTIASYSNFRRFQTAGRIIIPP